MSVTTEIQVPVEDFELGRAVRIPEKGTVELEAIVVVGDNTGLCFRVYGIDRCEFEALNDRPPVEVPAAVDVFDDQALYTLEWSPERDRLFRIVCEQRAQTLRGTGTNRMWTFEFRFPSHTALSAFRIQCERSDISLRVVRIHGTSELDAGSWFGTTARQREALTLAVRKGYYDIPRGCTTNDLSEELGISGQAVTERLRRGIVALVSNTVASNGSDRE